jgi:aminoglycoside phosphotransferase (APT) family kinase protein
VIRAAFDWCASHRPQPEPAATLGWGDARYGNIVFGDDFRVRAVLDWEMATIAPPEVDLGWFCFIHDTTRMFFDDLPGFVDRPRWLGRYATALGRDVDDLRWYEAWAGVRAAAIQAQMVRRAFERGDAADLRGREEANPVVASLRRVLPDI